MSQSTSGKWHEHVSRNRISCVNKYHKKSACKSCCKVYEEYKSFLILTMNDEIYFLLRTCTLETGYLQLRTHYPHLYLSRKNSNKTGWKKNKTVCEIRKYLRSSKNARDVWKNPSLQYNASMCPAERELGASPSALVVVTAADLRNIFHFTESGATERRRDRWPRWPWHNTLLPCSTELRIVRFQAEKI